MGASSFHPLASIPFAADLRREKTRLVVRMLVISSMVVFAIETGLMFVLQTYLDLPEPVVLVLDGILLVAFLFPFNYFFIVRRMLKRIEEQHHTSLELVKSYEILERFFSISGVMIAYMDADFNFVRVNQAYAEANGHEPEFFIGKNHFTLFPNAVNRRIFEQVVASGEPFNILEKPFGFAEHSHGEVSYWDWNFLPIKDPRQQVIELLLVLNDVTERVKAQQTRIDSERRFRAVFNQTFQHMGMLNPKGEVLVFNQTALNFSGLEMEKLEGKPLWQLPWWMGPAETLDQLRMAVEKASAGSVSQCEQRVHSISGTAAIMDISIKPLLDEHGATLLLIYEARDISQRIQYEEALKRSEAEIGRLYQAEMTAHRMAETLHRAILALTGSLEVDTVLETLLDHLFEVVPYSSAHIGMFDSENQLVVRAARGERHWLPHERLLDRHFDIVDVAVLKEMIEEHSLVNVPDTILFPETTFLPVDRFVRSWVGIPLMVRDQVIGVCLLEHECPGFFSQELLRWAKALTGQAGVAIQNAWLFEQVQDGREHLQALSRRLVEAQETERHYIARELHDEAGQALASLMVGLRLLEREGGDRDSVLARSAELKQIADGVLENLHRLAMDLRPATLDHLGLVAALRQHAETVSDRHGIVVQFETVGRIERLLGEVETAIYRIVQEALTNVVRHAAATRVDILLERRKESMFVIVEDNGIGFDPSEIHVDHLGMLGMRERANALGGSITIESAAGKGTAIMLEVPCLFEY